MFFELQAAVQVQVVRILAAAVAQVDFFILHLSL
jgi:hypothetical protein